MYIFGLVTIYKLMASAFWYLEDGRCFSRTWCWMSDLLELINKEIKCIEGAELFAAYLGNFIMNEGDESNGYGGFIKHSTDESVMINIDLREFTEQNRAYFWQGTQMALNKLIRQKNESN